MATGPLRSILQIFWLWVNNLNWFCLGNEIQSLGSNVVIWKITWMRCRKSIAIGELSQLIFRYSFVCLRFFFWCGKVSNNFWIWANWNDLLPKWIKWFSMIYYQTKSRVEWNVFTMVWIKLHETFLIAKEQQWSLLFWHVPTI